MSATTITVLGLCLVLLAHGIPTSRLLKKPTSVDKHERSKSRVLGNPAERTVTTSFSGALTTSSQFFYKDESYTGYFYYFQAIDIYVNVSGTYTFHSVSDLDTVGYLYDAAFDPAFPDTNLITWDDDGDIDAQFLIEVFLQQGSRYILAVTTYHEEEVGAFTVIASGPGTAFLTATTVTPSVPLTTPYVPPVITTTVPSALTTSSSTFHRIDGDPSSLYYYQAFQITVATAGDYIFSSSSDLDTMGFFYSNQFDPSNPYNNLLVDDDDSAVEVLQFELEAYLQPGSTYVLVVTTHPAYATDSFTLIGKGPDNVTFMQTTPS